MFRIHCLSWTNLANLVGCISRRSPGVYNFYLEMFSGKKKILTILTGQDLVHLPLRKCVFLEGSNEKKSEPVFLCCAYLNILFFVYFFQRQNNAPYWGDVLLAFLYHVNKISNLRAKTIAIFCFMRETKNSF